MSASSWHQFHLIVGVGSTAVPGPIEKIEVPEGVSFLVPGSGARPRLGPERTEDGSFVIEPVYVEHQPQLILLSPPGKRPRLNGHVAPRAALVRERDTLQIDDEFVLHVATYYRPRIGPPPAEWIGKDCPICRTTFIEGTRVYVCPCGQPLHLETEAHRRTDHNPLVCATTTTECPSCLRPIVLKECYSYYPSEVDLG